MGHVLLARQERPLPYDLPAASDSRHALHIAREIADKQLVSDACRAQLRMREPQIVLALGQVIREFVAERKADAGRSALGVDQIDADDLGFLAAVQGEARARKVAFGRDKN